MGSNFIETTISPKFLDDDEIMGKEPRMGLLDDKEMAFGI